MAKSIIQTSGINILIALLNVLTGIILARLLGPTNRGELAAAQMIPLMISTIALIGLPQAVVYWVSHEKESSKQTILTTLILFIPINIFVCFLGYLLIPYMLPAQSEQVIHAARVYLLVIFQVSFGSIYVWGLQGLRNFTYWNIVRLISPITWLLAILTGYALNKLSIIYLVLFPLIVNFPLVIIFMVYFWRQLEGPSNFRIKRAKNLIRYGLPITFSSIPQTLNLRLDQLLMAAFLPPELLGLYIVGVTWSSASRMILSSVGSVITPSLAALDENNHVQAYQIVGMSTRSSIMLVTIIVFGQAIVTPIAIPLLFGKAYLPAVSAAIVLVIAGGVKSLSLVWRDILYGFGDTKSGFIAEIVGLIVTCVALAVLLEPFQIVGASVASLISYMVTLIYFTFVLKRQMKKPMRFFLLPTHSDARQIGQKFYFYLRKFQSQTS